MLIINISILKILKCQKTMITEKTCRKTWGGGGREQHMVCYRKTDKAMIIILYINWILHVAAIMSVYRVTL
jgi:hypothetical protein